MLVASFCTGSLKLDEGVDCVLEFFNHTTCSINPETAATMHLWSFNQVALQCMES